MENSYQKTFQADWSDMDYNSHMRNTAYLEKSADMRMMFFSDHDFPMKEFVQSKIGPVIMKDKIEYFREVNLMDELEAYLVIAGLSRDGSRWQMRNEFFSSDGKLTAKVSSVGGWLDLSARKLVAAPPKLLAALERRPKTKDFQFLDAITREGK
ncbi:MAG: thioesterase family protein [Deltaproteobacteria bacterium]|jgi:acyl-CoA thioester hydrolase|nr:thioesterase family protein [Deltaproteobacteria bacterium]